SPPPSPYTTHFRPIPSGDIAVNRARHSDSPNEVVSLKGPENSATITSSYWLASSSATRLLSRSNSAFIRGVLLADDVPTSVVTCTPDCEFPCIRSEERR